MLVRTIKQWSLKINQVLEQDQSNARGHAGSKAQANTLTASDLTNRLQGLLGGNHV